MGEELKPCPRCRSKAAHDNLGGETINPDGSNSGGYYPNDYIVFCTTCKIMTECHATLEDAVNDWNTRSDPPWSTDPPTEPGWYWAVFVENPSLCEIIYVFIEHDSNGKIFYAQRPTMCVHYFQESGRSVPWIEFTKIHSPLRWLKIDEPEVIQ